MLWREILEILAQFIGRTRRPEVECVDYFLLDCRLYQHFVNEVLSGDAGIGAVGRVVIYSCPSNEASFSPVFNHSKVSSEHSFTQVYAQIK